MDNTEIKQAYSISEFCQAHAVGRTTVFNAIKSGVIVAKKFGRRTLITKVEAERWLNSL